MCACPQKPEEELDFQVAVSPSPMWGLGTRTHDLCKSSKCSLVVHYGAISPAFCQHWYFKLYF